MKETTIDNQKTQQEAQPQEKRLSYEELNNAAMQLVEQNRQLNARLAEANRTLMFRRLDYLFKCLEFAGVIKDAEFIGNCVDEIKAAISGPQEEEKE